MKPVIAGVLAAVLALAGLGRVDAQTLTPAGPPQQGVGQARIESLIASMTLDEKVSMLYGTTDPKSSGQAGYVPGVPRLGIPPLRLADGPAGIRTAQPATALPAPVAMASTFSLDLARQYGRIIMDVPRTVVVRNNGAPILTPWADKVAGILQMWYPGQGGADATCAILLGEAAPGGRLPVT